MFLPRTAGLYQSSGHDCAERIICGRPTSIGSYDCVWLSRLISQADKRTRWPVFCDLRPFGGN